MSEAVLSTLHTSANNWLTFNWQSQLVKIEQTLATSKESRDVSQTARKELAETTKQFKRSVKAVEQASASLSADPTAISQVTKAIDSLAKECRTTVKAYQEEIDNLTRRCKFSETAYGNLTQALQELADPTSVLQSAAEQLQAQQSQMANLLGTVEQLNKELQNQEKLNQSYKKEISSLQSKSQGSVISKEERDELVKLRREVAEYEVEFRSLKNQDITIRKLEARIEELQTAGEEKIREELEKAKEELAESEGRRAAEALEREAAMERKLQTLELQLRAERAGREATQAHLLEADEGVSQREAAWEAQRRILVDDAERIRESYQAASRERDELRLRVAALEGRDLSKHSSTPPASGGFLMADLVLERKAYEAEVAELSETVSLLREELRLKDESLEEERRESRNKIDDLHRQIMNLNAQLVSLEMQVASAPSQTMVDSMKRELRILKRLEYNAHDVDVDRDPEIAGVNEDDEKDLEAVLIAKLRRAESDLVRERVSKNEISMECDRLKEALHAAENAKERADELIASLENDLERAISSAASGAKPTSSKSLSIATAEEDPSTLEMILDPSTTASAPPVASLPRLTSTSASEKADDDHSVATIVMAQRDRLRARCEALEAERDSFKRELQAQVQASESLKSDNTKLYEKVRYLQNYNKAPSSRGGYQAGLDRDLDLEALEQRYEASVDPFRQFSKSERQRKLNEMSPMERTVYLVAKTFLATKEMRTGLFFYVVAMHLLVFVTTYHWSHTDGCHNFDVEHLAHLPPVLAAQLEEQLANKTG